MAARRTHAQLKALTTAFTAWRVLAIVGRESDDADGEHEDGHGALPSGSLPGGVPESLVAEPVPEPGPSLPAVRAARPA
eukprot:8126964-Alexandrium_andersonii.AAC.1